MSQVNVADPLVSARSSYIQTLVISASPCDWREIPVTVHA
jgi:hypothetical protein